MPVIGKLSSVLANPAVYLTYQYLVGGIRARKRCISEHVRPAESLTVLDIGCGPGYAIQCFRRPQYYGFDPSPDYIRYAKTKFSPAGEFVCGYFDEAALHWLPQIDVVLLMGVLHHMDDRQAIELLTLARRAMKPAGRLFTLDGCYRPAQSWLERYFLDRDRGKYIRDEPSYRKLAGEVFRQVNVFYREDLFVIPQPTLIMECMQCPR